LSNPVYSKNYMKAINTLCGQNTELLNVKAGGSSNILRAILEMP